MVTILSKLKSFTSVVQVYQPFTIYQPTHLLTVTPVLSAVFSITPATVLAAGAGWKPAVQFKSTGTAGILPAPR
jgi:hypothetical protein